MFNHGLQEKIDGLQEKGNELKIDFERTKLELNIKLKNEREDVDVAIAKFENKFEARLIQFHKEVTEKYFEALEKIFRLNKEVSLINALAGQAKDKDYALMRAQFIKPFLEQRWEEEKSIKGKKIESYGVWIQTERARMHEEMLTMEKQEKNTEAIKERIAAFDSIIGRMEK